MSYRNLKILRDNVIGWVVAIIFWLIMRTYGVSDNAIEHPEANSVFRLILIFGPLVGVFYGFVQIQMERYLYKRVPLWKLVLIGTGANTLIIGITIVFGYFFIREFVGFRNEISFTDYLQSPSTILVFFYSVLVNVVMSSIRQINLLLGEGNLLKILRGDFYSPRVENRIFMFVDLKGSTAIAEELGHIQYSRFIQDCFYDLFVVHKYGAEVYQYVGDEVVLSWELKRRMKLNNCIKAFWAFQDRLVKRRAYYLKKYGVYPTFKAGINEGEVTVAEVGEIKREIAYHGDTMNITSRIQEMCNVYEKELLITESFYKRLKSRDKFLIECMGQEELRGKNAPIKIYAVEREFDCLNMKKY